MSLLNIAWSWTDFFKAEYTDQLGIDANTVTLLNKVFNIISIVLWVVLGLVGAVGAVYAIFLGIQLARAEEQGKRDDAKKHLITVFIAIGVTVALILVFNTFMPALITAFIKPDNPQVSGGGGESVLRPLLSMLKAY